MVKAKNSILYIVILLSLVSCTLTVTPSTSWTIPPTSNGESAYPNRDHALTNPSAVDWAHCTQNCTVESDNVVASANGIVVAIMTPTNNSRCPWGISSGRECNKSGDSSKDYNPWGNAIVIEYRDDLPLGFVGKYGEEQSLYVVYAYLADNPALVLGDTVTPGQLLGQIGATGNVVTRHLHTETSVLPSGSISGITDFYTFQTGTNYYNGDHSFNFNKDTFIK